MNRPQLLTLALTISALAACIAAMVCTGYAIYIAATYHDPIAYLINSAGIPLIAYAYLVIRKLRRVKT